MQGNATDLAGCGKTPRNCHPEPFAVILSAAKNLALPLRVNCAKDLALSIFKAMRDSSSLLLLRMTVPTSFSAARSAQDCEFNDLCPP